MMTIQEKAKFNKFIIWILVLGVGISLISGLIVNYYSKTFPTADILVSFIVATVNVLAGAFVIVRVLHKSNKAFFIYMLLSVGVRMFVIMTVFIVCLLVFKFSPVYFTITFFALYFSYLILELFFIIKFKETTNI
ncbi:MAG TPA: hypothetical protein VHP32_09875 [Ignavibacteria bacterium]|nr:hypothetical protein [Ignavibacteria bacterium]